MGTKTAISWTDHSFNPWWGCARVSPGCEHCYAETWAKRTGFGNTKPLLWGAAADRRFFGPAHWNEPRRWNKAAGLADRIDRVFCASMCDVFEPRDDVADSREGLWALIGETPNLTWQLLTKRPGRVEAMVPERWREEWPANVWLGVTTEDQKRADERLAVLTRLARDLCITTTFASYEPALEAVDFTRWDEGLDWIIVGGESGPKARPFDLKWARDAIWMARHIGATPFVKQLGSDPIDGLAGCEVRLRDPHGADPGEWPEELRVQEFPSPCSR